MIWLKISGCWKLEPKVSCRVWSIVRVWAPRYYTRVVDTWRSFTALATVKLVKDFFSLTSVGLRIFRTLHCNTWIFFLRIMFWAVDVSVTTNVKGGRDDRSSNVAEILFQLLLVACFHALIVYYSLFDWWYRFLGGVETLLSDYQPTEQQEWWLDSNFGFFQVAGKCPAKGNSYYYWLVTL